MLFHLFSRVMKKSNDVDRRCLVTTYCDNKNTLTLAFSKNPVHGPAKPIVTIGICVKDCDASVEEALDSVFNQNFPLELMEIVVVDDGSEDQTLSVVLNAVSRTDMRVRVFHSEWMGLGPARNVVVDNAKGEYIVWVDGDMILPVDHVKKQVEFMGHNPKVGIAKARHVICSGRSLVGTLEDIAHVVVDSKYGGKTTSKLPGTGGSIYRVEAIKQVGGFEESLTGVGEDIEAANRIRKAGWLVYVGTIALFYERRKQTWKTLWNQYFWYGCGGYDILRGKSGIINFYKMSPLAGLIVGLQYSVAAYKLTRRKMVFLLPLHYVFKMTAWFLGFVRSQIGSQGIQTKGICERSPQE